MRFLASCNLSHYHDINAENSSSFGILAIRNARRLLHIQGLLYRQKCMASILSAFFSLPLCTYLESAQLQLQARKNRQELNHPLICD
uniref:Uncharacterized protein n=1 Tax=Ornithorhynchus anatinus TaxID=9258 RepID=A0A6I8P160_ORNAN